MRKRVRRTIRGFRRRIQGAREWIDRWVPKRPPDPYAAFEGLDTPHLVRVPGLVTDTRSVDAPRLVVLMPSLRLSRLTGGPNTVLSLTARLALDGIRVRYVSAYLGIDRQTDPLHAHIERLAGRPLPADAIEFVDGSTPGGGVPVGRGDVLLATWWPTAHLARDALARTGGSAFVYAIQDYEPGFYPWSSTHVMADATYRFPHRSVFNQGLLRDYFRQHRVGSYGGPDEPPSVTFEPAVDRTLFHAPSPGDARPPRRRLLFYARPRIERNAFELGLRGLRLAAAQGAFDPEAWELRSVGTSLPDFALAPGVSLVNAPWLPYADYAAYLRDSSILLSLMLSPHTSYPPLEMAASGGTVITNTFDVKTADLLSAISPGIRGVAADPDAIADALVRAVADVDGTERHGHDAAAFGLPATWDESLATAVPWLAATVRELAAGH
ncbi:MAG TPA: hypothetical protein VH813_02005 [Candidatus Limnocylindrales bacterium]|jgi:hypothetical protein